MHIKKLLGHLWLKETSDNLDDVILVADLKRALDNIKLNAIDKDILEKYNEGYTEEKIAKKLKINQSTVNRRIASISKRISEYLAR